jgi:hypothetical protein
MSATVKTNIALKIDSRLLQEAKIAAAQNGTSISAMMATRLEEVVRQKKSYARARRRALGRMRKGFDLHFTLPSWRDELYRR